MKIFPNKQLSGNISLVTIPERIDVGVITDAILLYTTSSLALLYLETLHSKLRHEILILYLVEL